jgi:hypothetical protein
MMEAFKIEYKILDYTLSPPTVMLFDKKEHFPISIWSILYGLLPADFIFDIKVGAYKYSIEKERIHTVQHELKGALRELLGLEKTISVSEEDTVYWKIPALLEGEKYASMSLRYIYIYNIPDWNFVFHLDSDVVKVYPRLYEGPTEASKLVPLLPPWNVVEGEPINQPAVLCSKKQIVSELYKLYLNMVKDAKKMYPEEFKDEYYMEEAYEDWLEEMKEYKALIKKL